MDLTVGTFRYEHTEALFDGSVTIDGVAATMRSADLISDLFFQMVHDRDIDICELGLTYFLRTMELDDPPFLALPIFPNRNFRHESVFVSKRSGITGPKDLIGRTIGEFALYGHDPGVWIKGILADEYGVRPEQCSWVIGGTDHPIPSFGWLPQPVPAGVDVRHAPDGVTLSSMLESGEIDALISVDVPQAVLDGTGSITRLWPDYEQVERDYYRRTGIFPMMHAVAVRKELASDAELMTSIYAAFDRAKEIVAERYRKGASKQHMSVLTPWFSELFAENRALMGDDWWPYGMKRNRTAVDAFLRYHYGQGLSRKLWKAEDLFVPGLP